MDNTLQERREEIIEFYSVNSLKKTSDRFGVGTRRMKSFLQSCGVYRTREETSALNKEMSRNKQRNRRAELSNDVIEYYKTHSMSQTATEFRIDITTVKKILSENNVPEHTTHEINSIRKEERIKKYGNYRNEDKLRQTCLEKFGVPTTFNPIAAKKTKKELYNNENFVNVEKRRKTCVAKYGTPSASGCDDVKKKVVETSLKNFGVSNPSMSKSVKDKIRDTKLSLYGGFGYDSKIIREKCISTCKSVYGVDWFCQTQECKLKHGSSSKPNENFSNCLSSVGFESGEIIREFSLDKYVFDFLIGNTLIEVNPWATHNSDWSPFGNPVSEEYHSEKSMCALNRGYNFISVWDWTDAQIVAEILYEKYREHSESTPYTLSVRNIDESSYIITVNGFDSTTLDDISCQYIKDSNSCIIKNFGMIILPDDILSTIATFLINNLKVETVLYGVDKNFVLSSPTKNNFFPIYETESISQINFSINEKSIVHDSQIENESVVRIFDCGKMLFQFKQ